MASRRTPGADPRCTERGKGADSERLPLSPCGAKRERSAETQDSELGAGTQGASETARGYRRPVQPGGAGSREVPSFRSCPEPRSLRPLQRPQPPAARLAPLRKEAAPAPPRAAPTNWRKISFSKPELGTSVPLTVFYVDTGLCRP